MRLGLGVGPALADGVLVGSVDAEGDADGVCDGGIVSVGVAVSMGG